MGNQQPIPRGIRKRVAVIVTEYRFNSHADVILGRLLGDFGYLPKVEVASLYTDQVPDNDMSREAAARCNIPICPTIAETIERANADGGVDGVIIIGEHGDYPEDGKGRKHYPRRRFLTETLAALDGLGLRIPIFSDKHFSWSIEDTLWMYKQLKRRGIPFMGGSSIPHAPQVPTFDSAHLLGAKEIMVVSFSTTVEAYGYHALEVLQSIAEKRVGGVTGVRSVNVLEGAEVWEAMDRNEWPEDLMLSALAVKRTTLADQLQSYEPLLPPQPHPREGDDPVWLFVIEYEDGTMGYVIQQNNLTEQWRFAVRNGSGAIVSAICDSDLERPFGHFETLTRLIEQFIITGIEPFPMERVLMSSGLIYYVLESLYYHKKMETPELRLHYRVSTSV
jgi:hypothetical protein